MSSTDAADLARLRSDERARANQRQALTEARLCALEERMAALTAPADEDEDAGADAGAKPGAAGKKPAAASGAAKEKPKVEAAGEVYRARRPLFL